MSYAEHYRYHILSGRGDSSYAFTKAEMKLAVERYRELPLTARQKEAGLTEQPVHIFKRKKVKS